MVLPSGDKATEVISLLCAFSVVVSRFRVHEKIWYGLPGLVVLSRMVDVKGTLRHFESSVKRTKGASENDKGASENDKGASEKDKGAIEKESKFSMQYVKQI